MSRQSDLLRRLAVATAEKQRLDLRTSNIEAEIVRLRLQIDAEMRNDATTDEKTHRPSRTANVSASSMTKAEKIALFRSLFRGRDDVYPRLWTSKSRDRKGYSPVCANEWQDGVCEKPQVRCGDCAFQSWLPVDDAAVRDHLEGRQTIGVYPLLKDDTTWFLAFDFD